MTSETRAGKVTAQRRLLIVGAGRRATRLHEALRQSAPVEWQIEGFVEPVELSSSLRKSQPTDVVIALDAAPAAECSREVMQVMASGVRVILADDFFQELTARLPVEDASNLWREILARRRLGRNFYLPIKRAIDLVVCIGSLFILAPFMALIALAIKLETKESLFDREERVGQFGRRFNILRFRTRVAGAGTRTGRLLGRYGLDKLPALMNIIKGDMSIIGPAVDKTGVATRLEREFPIYSARWLVRPGLIGWGSIHRRRDIRCLADPVRALEYDLYYVRHVSPALDLLIVFKMVASFRR